ncbi:MAG: VOC family protein [Solirubrobacteraceae bacterium]
MSRRDSYPPGVPCFVETLTPDPNAAQRFYAGIFGWEFAGSGPLPGPGPAEYFIARHDGHDVAGLALLPPEPIAPPPPAWDTHVSVADLDEAAARAVAAGGSLRLAPFDALPAGRLAVVADPAGAVFCLWEAGSRPGAALVNEPSAWAMSLLSTDDPEGAQVFYGELFGWRAEGFEAGPGIEMWLWRLPGYVGGEPHQPVPRDVVAAMARLDASAEAPGPHWSVDFWIADADAAADTAPGLGGSVLAAPFEVAGFRRTVLADPQGAVFSASQLLLPA